MAHWNPWFPYWKCWFSTAMWVYDRVFFCERFFQKFSITRSLFGLTFKPFFVSLMVLFFTLLQNGSLQDPILSLEGDNFGFLGCPMIFCPPQMVQKFLRANCRTKSDTLSWLENHPEMQIIFLFSYFERGVSTAMLVKRAPGYQEAR